MFYDIDGKEGKYQHSRFPMRGTWDIPAPPSPEAQKAAKAQETPHISKEESHRLCQALFKRWGV